MRNAKLLPSTDLKVSLLSVRFSFVHTQLHASDKKILATCHERPAVSSETNISEDDEHVCRYHMNENLPRPLELEFESYQLLNACLKLFII